MYIKKNARTTFRSNRRSNFKRNNNFSNNKFKNKGNVTQQYNKYLKLAKEASSSSDRIQSEIYYQYTDHYYRLMVELGISIEQNDNEAKTSISESTDNNAENGSTNVDNNSQFEEKKESESSQNEEDNEDIESIESIPFISEPPKKKTTKNKKVTA